MKILKLGDICEISTGSTDTKDASENGQYPLFDRSKKVKASDKYLFDCEALIMPGEGAEFLPRHYIGKFDLHQRAYAMYNFSELINPQYLYYYLISVKNYFADNAVGATVKSLRRRHFTDLEVPLPSLEKQSEIVTKLDSAFAEIELAGIHLRKRVSSYCSLEEAFINERLRQNCETFTSNKLSDITSKIGSGATPRGGEESYKSEGISLIRSLNVYDDGFREKKLAFIDEVQAKALANVEIKTGDVLLNITGASIARTCIAPKEYLPARVNQHVSIIRPKPEIISTEYLHFLLRSQRMKSSLLGVGNSGGSTRQALTKVDLENTIVEFPPDLEDQKEAVDDLKSFGDLSKTYMNNLSKIESLYSDLQNSLLISELSGSIN